ncbi:MAG: restriction endonuclease subunit S [Bacteroidetes bacterium]|jgi:type I restriction enzyme S subunit|nr:restriction endonuclease subunit S [Bacteroidota bacterium]HMT76945.1 restriction endonuclease subunit S [Saprospiraceae bacterium]
MQVARNTYLKFVPFQDFNLWDVKVYKSKKLKPKFSLAKLNNFLSADKMEWVEIEDEKEYPILGVRGNGKGVYINRVAKGSELTMKKYQKSKVNYLFYCKVRTVNGQWGIVYPEFENSYGSSNMQYLEVDESKINLRFFELLLSIKSLTTEFDKNAIGADGRHFTLKTLLSLEIPLPSLSEQEILVKNYFNKIEEAEKLSQQANDLETEIERYFLEQLGIEKTKKQFRKNTLSSVAFENIEKWGVEYNLGVKSNCFLNSLKYKLNKLKTLIDINPSTILPKDDLEISFIPMECISDERGEVIELRNKKTSEAKGYTKFKEGDLIWARITPCMQNGKSAIVNNLTNGLGVGSTEFHVLRNSRNDVNIMFIHTLLRLDIVLKNAMSHFTGSAGQQRVPKSFLEELEVPLPPISKQQEIVNHIQELKEKIKNQKAQAEQLKNQAEQEFEQAIFS